MYFSTRSEGEPKMAICSCRLDAHSLLDLCARCVGEYLNLCAQAEIEDRLARTTSDSETPPIGKSKADERTQACSHDNAEAATLSDVRNVEQEMLILMSRARDALEDQHQCIVQQGRRIAALEIVVRGLLKLRQRKPP